MNINELRKQRAEHWEKMKNFLNTHEQKNGTLSIDDTATYKNMEAEFDSMSEAITRAENAAQRENELNRPVASPILDTLSGKPGTTGRGSEEYNKEFLNYIRTRRASNALQEGTSTEGGYLVPTEFEQTLYTARDSVDPIFDLAGRITLGALEKNVPYVSSEGAAALVAEEGSYGDTDDAFGQVVFHAYKFGRICKASDELISDSVFDINAYLAQSFGRAIGKAEAGYFWTGTGSSQPQGVMTAAGTGVTTAAANQITADEIIDLYYSVPEEYRANAAFAMKDTTVAMIRKLKLGTGEYLWAPGLDGSPDTLMGRPLRTSANIDGVASSKKVIAFGDFEACYKIADREGFEFKVLDQLYAATGQVGFRGSARSDGKGILASTGIKILKMHS
jgi:HK97 family phage major capsid protein